MPSSLPWELSAPHQLGPTAKGHFSLKPAPWTKPKGTLGSGDERPAQGALNSSPPAQGLWREQVTLSGLICAQSGPY